MSELDKIKYHIKMIGETINSLDHPIASLVISMDWDGDDLNKAHDIFEAYDNKINNEEEDINWTGLELDLRSEFDIGYQTVKSIILAFYRNYQWIEVCAQYALSHMCVEFHEIKKDRESQNI